eukprot:s1288_g23.t1
MPLLAKLGGPLEGLDRLKAGRLKAGKWPWERLERLKVMSCLPVREEILHGMLSSRLVTFQTFDYLRHFMSCCAELLGCRHSFQKGGILQVEHEGRSVVVFADHFAIPYNHLVRKLSDEKVLDRATSIRNEFKGKIIIGFALSSTEEI